MSPLRCIILSHKYDCEYVTTEKEVNGELREVTAQPPQMKWWCTRSGCDHELTLPAGVLP